MTVHDGALRGWVIDATCGIGVLVLAGLAGCVDAHHFDAHHDAHDVHHDHHYVEHHAPVYTVVNNRPAPPAQPPVPGPGHWVWDDTRQQYIWVSERAQP